MRCDPNPLLPISRIPLTPKRQEILPAIIFNSLFFAKPDSRIPGKIADRVPGCLVGNETADALAENTFSLLSGLKQGYIPKSMSIYYFSR